ncbi:MAG: sugar ABC transporter ATP-binding protein [Micromonosporaceae bacterium]
MAELLRLSGIHKRYGGVRALRGVDFELRPGEVHALIGENGAGKSTLIKIISGAEVPDQGAIEMAGRKLHTGSTTRALGAGIATVYQEPQLFGELSVAENVFIGRELRGRGGTVDWAAQRGRVTALLSRLGLDPAIADVRVADLPVAEQQLVSIAKAFAYREGGSGGAGGEKSGDGAGAAKVLILDEPSAILTDREIDTLFGVIRTVTDQGTGVIYISHRLDELSLIADRVTVMRDGAVVASKPAADLTVRAIAELMVGHKLDQRQVQREVPDSDPALQVRGLGRGGSFADLDFGVRPGEILGLYGLVGSGTGAVARALYGIDPAHTGQVEIGGRPVTLASPADAARAGIGMLPGNRKQQGVFASKSIGFNISVGHLKVLSRLSWVDRRRERTVAREFIKRIAIKAPGVKTLLGTLSGGNQQKVVLARSLVERPEILLLEEPTQGVDVGAKEEIHDIVLGLADEGSAVLVISTDLPEVLKLADRVLVLRDGRTVREFTRGAGQADVLAAAAGESGEHTALDDARATIDEEVGAG